MQEEEQDLATTAQRSTLKRRIEFEKERENPEIQKTHRGVKRVQGRTTHTPRMTHRYATVEGNAIHPCTPQTLEYTAPTRRVHGLCDATIGLIVLCPSASLLRPNEALPS